jgi:hypothetical protein
LVRAGAVYRREPAGAADDEWDLPDLPGGDAGAVSEWRREVSMAKGTLQMANGAAPAPRTRTVVLGPCELPLTKQLEGLAPYTALEVLELHAQAITRLHIHGLLDNLETLHARKRLLKRIQATISDFGSQVSQADQGKDRTDEPTRTTHDGETHREAGSA